MCLGTYLDRVGCRLTEATWLADIGLPLAATLVSILIVYLLVRRQLKQQVELRRADRLVTHIADFGATVAGVVNKMDSTAGTDPYWRRPTWDGWSTIYYARLKLIPYLNEPNAFEEILRGTFDLRVAWEACYNRLTALEAEGMQPTTPDVSVAMDAALRRHMNDLQNAGEKLIRWDGLGSLPTFQPWPTIHYPRGPRRGQRTEEQQRWLSYFTREFERVLIKYAAKSP